MRLPSPYSQLPLEPLGGLSAMFANNVVDGNAPLSLLSRKLAAGIPILG